MLSPFKIESSWRGTSNCRDCGIRSLVLFADLNEDDFKLIHAPIDDLAFKTGEALFTEGSIARGVFTVRSGMVKLVRISSDGRQRIVRVLRAGDLLGLEALAAPRYVSDAIALSDLSVCRVPLEVIQRLSTNSPRLHLKLMQKWQQNLKDADDWLADLNFGSARQRVCSLILKMRNPTEPDVATLFAREDMGAMLDLKFETVSREVSRLVREGVIEPLDRQGRLYRVSQLDRLKNL